jgi:hypothetical protein
VSGVAAAGFAPAITSSALIASVGTPQPEHVAFARQLLASLPPQVYAAAHDVLGAAALLFAVLLSEHEEQATAAQDAALRAHGGEPLVRRTRELARHIAPLGQACRLPLLDLLLPALRQRSQAELLRVRGTAAALITADDRIDIFEFTLLHLLDRHVSAFDRQRSAASAAATKAHSFATIRPDCELVLSAIAWSGAEDAGAAAEAFTAGADSLPRLQGLALRPQPDASIASLNEAFARLRSATPAIRRVFLEACTHAVAHDARVQFQEAELLRAVAEAIDCPMPPVAAAAPAGTMPSIG